MPIYEVRCRVCGQVGEALQLQQGEDLVCPACGARDVERLMSAPSDLTGRTPQAVPGPRDRACCGATPSTAGCAGPGSCCGKAYSR